jgi:hypothetical protein
VPLNDQHARINVSATHRPEQLDRFLAVLREVREELIWTLEDKEAARLAAAPKDRCRAREDRKARRRSVLPR